MFQLTLARKKILWAYLFLAIPLIFFLYFRIYPTLFAFEMSLFDWNPLAQEQEFIGTENYERLATELSNPRSVTRAAFNNTFVYVALGVPIQLAIALLVALMLNEIGRLTMLYRLLFFLPFVTSTISIAWVFRALYQPQFGFLNVVLTAFSLPQQPFLKHPGQALYSILAMIIWQGLGFAIIIFLAGLKQIPRDYYEAATVDGANRWQSFRAITLPLLNPSIVYLLVLQSISFLRTFAPVLAMTNQGDGGPLNSTTTVVLRIYREAFQRFDMGFASAQTVLLFLIILVVTIVQMRMTTRATD